MMTAALIIVPGFEDIAVAEVRELVGAKATPTAAGTIIFKAEPADMCKLCYFSQSASSVLIDSIPVPFDFNRRDYLVFGQSNDIKGNLAYLLLRAAGYNPAKHFLFDPFTRSGAIAIEAALFSSGFPVNYYRRDALSAAFSKIPQFSAVGINKVFSAIGAAAAKRKKVKPKILASASLMQDVRSAEKNAKIAGVNKLIRFSRLDIEWLDAKLDEHSVDLVVSYPPQFKSGNDQFAASENNKLKSLYKEFFCHADFFMKHTGSVVLLLNDETKDAASSASKFFKQKPLRKLHLGNEQFELVSFAKL